LLEGSDEGAKKTHTRQGAGFSIVSLPPRDHERSEYSLSLRTIEKPACRRWLFCVKEISSDLP